jgi:hypothetical protein
MKKYSNIKKYVVSAATLTALSSFAIAMPAMADTTNAAPSSENASNGGWQGHGGMGGDMGNMGGPNGARVGMGPMGHALSTPFVVGTVSTVSGNTLTILGKEGFGSTTATTTFTVDATNATVKKNNATSTVSNILVGDTVAIQGTINGSNITATTIRDGVFARPIMGTGYKNTASTTLPIVGNGEPVVAGTVSSVNGSTLLITNKSNVQYTVDAANAKIIEGQNTIVISNINVGDAVLVQGTINGTSVVASTVVDQANPVKTATTSAEKNQNHMGGFFGGIGQFFMHMFGF